MLLVLPFTCKALKGGSGDFESYLSCTNRSFMSYVVEKAILRGGKHTWLLWVAATLTTPLCVSEDIKGPGG